MATPDPDLKRLGRYDIERVLGKGAMGVVYGGVDPRLNRKVAIKTILKSALDEDTAKEYSMRFVREAQAVARLNHANIVQVYDFGEEGDVAYIVMEFIKGKELKDFFDAAERFDIKEAVHIMCELCEALDFAHEHGIVHRDIKPANVMIDSQGRVKLADFGVARIADADRGAAEKTAVGTVVGTPAYMSPEQIQGGEIDRRTDIFSAGIILYQFLTGEKPFTGQGAWTIAKKIIQDDPPLPSTVNAANPPIFDAVVQKALAKTVEARFQTAREFGIALKNALEGKGLEDEGDKTIVGGVDIDLGSPSPQMAMASPTATNARKQAEVSNQEVELEFWRSIKDGNDPDDFDLYVQQFPTGIYAALAKRKIAKLRGITDEDTGLKAKQAAEQEKREVEEAARKEAEAKANLAVEKKKLEEEMAKRQAEFEAKQAELEKKRQAEEKRRAEEDARAKAEFEAKLAAREAEFQKKQAEAEAQRQAQEKQRAAEQAKRDAEFQKKQAEIEAKRQDEEKKRQAELAKRQEEEKKRQAELAKKEAELREREKHAPKKLNPFVPIGIGLLVVAIGVGGYWMFAPDPSAQLKQQLALLEKANAEVAAAQAKQQEMIQALEKAKADEEAARKAGDTAKLKELEEARKQREAALAEQAALIKQRQEEAAKQAEAARKAAEDAKAKTKAQLDQEKAQAKAKADAEAKKVADAQAAAAREAEQKAAAAREAEQKAAAAREAEAKKQAEAEAAKRADSAEARKEAEAKKQADAAAAAAARMTDRQREAAENRRLLEEARQRAAELAAQQKSAAAAQASTAQTSTAASGGNNARATTTSAAKADDKPVVVAKAEPPGLNFYREGKELEASGKVRQAVRSYRRAAAMGNADAAKRLGEIYTNGLGDQPKDYAEGIRWTATAEKLGAELQFAGGR
ncbi:MAG TPA: protein kinase [Burkholderiales bacterium]